MNKNITYILVVAIILTASTIAHYEMTKEPQTEETATTTPSIIAAYNQGKVEGQNAMKNAIVLEVSKNGEVSIPFKVDFGDRVEDRVITLIEKKEL